MIFIALVGIFALLFGKIKLLPKSALAGKYARIYGVILLITAYPISYLLIDNSGRTIFNTQVADGLIFPINLILAFSFMEGVLRLVKLYRHKMSDEGNGSNNEEAFAESNGTTSEDETSQKTKKIMKTIFFLSLAICIFGMTFLFTQPSEKFEEIIGFFMFVSTSIIALLISGYFLLRYKIAEKPKTKL